MKKAGQKALALVMVTALSVTSLLNGNIANVVAGEEQDAKIVLTDDVLADYYSAVTENTVSVHDPSIVVGYIDEATYTASAKVYGTQNADKTRTEVYFIFGSHMAFAYSMDLVEWTTFTNNINTNYKELFAKEAAWAAINDSAYDLSGNLWAPDVIWNEDLGKWCMYMSVNGNNWNSSICMLTADSLNGNWTYVDTVVYSGFGTDARLYTLTDYCEVTGDTTLPGRYTNNGSGWYYRYGAHAIDPCVFYSEEGDLYMSYGSWSGGIYIFELDENTGLRDKNVKYETVEGKSDAYMGIKLGGSGASGEASYIEYIDGYYYLFLSYGGLVANGGYNMRVFRSATPTGEYKDFVGTPALNGGVTNGNVGTRLMSYYKWSWMSYAQVAQGHNSTFVDDDGRAYVIYHTRTNDGTEGHYVRTHQVFTTVNGGLVAAPFQYNTTDSTNVRDTELGGDYELIFQYNTDSTNLQYNSGVKASLNSDGTITGDVSGSWTVTDRSVATGEKNVELVIGGVTYEGVFVKQTMEGTNAQAVCFTAVGSNNICLWGAQYPSDAVAVAASAQVMNTTQSLPAITFADLTLKTEAMYGASVSWTSSDESVIATDGKFTRPAKDTDVTLTMVVTKGKYEYTKDYVVTAKAKMKGTEDRYLVATYYENEAFDLSTGATAVLANPFNNKVNGIKIDNGVAVKFDVEFTGSNVKALSNIWAFTGGGKLYFTGGSYLGYNAADTYFDANLRNYGLVKDYIGKKATVEVQFAKDGYKVFVDNMLAYSNTSLAEGTYAGTTTNYSDVLTWLNYTATEFDLGTGNWWSDVFEGKISNIRFYAEAVAEPSLSDDIDSYYYYQDYSKGDKSEWGSANASGALVIKNSQDEAYGKYLAMNAGSESGNRTAVASFAMDAFEGNYTIVLDAMLSAGNVANRSESGFAILGTDAVNANANAPVASGYILKLSNNFTADGLTSYHVNGSEEKYTIPANEWIHIAADVDRTAGTALVTITNKATGTVIYQGTVAINGSGALSGLQILRGRGTGAAAVDNIKVYEYQKEPAQITDEEMATEEVIGYVTEKDIAVKDAALTSIDCSGWWVAHSEGIKITETPMKITFHTQTYATANSNWNTPIYVFYSANEQFQGGANILSTAGYSEYMVARSDNYGWTPDGKNTGSGLAEGYSLVSDFSKFGSWETWLAANKAGTDVTVTAQLVDGKVVLTATNAGLVSNITVPVDTDKDTYLSLTGELCEITDIKYGYEAAKEYAVADKVECTTFWSAHSAGIEVTEDVKTITYHTQTTNATGNWNTPFYVLYAGDENKVNGAGYTELFVLRSDAYGWLTGANTNNLPEGYSFQADFSEFGSWETWLAKNAEGVDVTASVQLVDGNIVLTSINAGLTETLVVPASADKTNYLSIGGENCIVTDVKYILDKKTVLEESIPSTKLDTSAVEVAFGDVNVGYETVNKTYTVTNNNDVEITGLEVVVEGAGFQASIDKTSLAAGESATVTVSLLADLAPAAAAHYAKVIVESDNARDAVVKATVTVIKAYEDKIEESEEDPEDPEKDPEEDPEKGQTGNTGNEETKDEETGNEETGLTIVSNTSTERTYVEKAPVSQSIKGTVWWTANEVGTNYEVPVNGTLTIKVHVKELLDGYGAFNAELVDSGNRYLTTGSDKNAWYFDAQGDAIKGVVEGGASELTAGATYTILIKNSGADYTVTYLNEDGSVYHEFTAKNTNLAAPVNAHIIAQVGSYTITVEQDVTYTEKTTTIVYSNGSKKITVTTTGSDGSKKTVTKYVDQYGNETTEIKKEEPAEEIVKDEVPVKDNNDNNDQKQTESTGTGLTNENETASLVIEESYTLADVDASGWWAAHSKAVPITEKLTKIKFHGKSYATAKSNWNTPLYVIFAASEQFQGGAGILDTKDYTEYLVTRSDNYCWEPSGTNNLSKGGLAAGYSFTSEFIDFTDWETWLAHNLTGVDCELTIRRTGNYVIATLSNDGVISKAVIDVSKETKDLYVALTGELTVLTGITVEVYSGLSASEDEELIGDDSTVKGDDEKGDSSDKTNSDKAEENKAEETDEEASLTGSQAGNASQPWVMAVVILAAVLVLTGGLVVIVRKKNVIKK